MEIWKKGIYYLTICSFCWTTKFCIAAYKSCPSTKTYYMNCTNIFQTINENWIPSKPKFKYKIDWLCLCLCFIRRNLRQNATHHHTMKRMKTKESVYCFGNKCKHFSIHNAQFFIIFSVPTIESANNLIWFYRGKRCHGFNKMMMVQWSVVARFNPLQWFIRLFDKFMF